MAINSVSELTRPKNMVKTNTILLALDSCAVMPLLRPTVLYADTHSKAILSKLAVGSKIEMLSIAIAITKIERIINAKDLLTVVEDISRLYTSKRVFPLAILIILSIANAKELVLIPPPVEPGEAPTHIKKITMNTVVNALKY